LPSAGRLSRDYSPPRHKGLSPVAQPGDAQMLDRITNARLRRPVTIATESADDTRARNIFTADGALRSPMADAAAFRRVTHGIEWRNSGYY